MFGTRSSRPAASGCNTRNSRSSLRISSCSQLSTDTEERESYEEDRFDYWDRLRRGRSVDCVRSSKADQGTNDVLHVGMEGRPLPRRASESAGQSTRARLG